MVRSGTPMIAGIYCLAGICLTEAALSAALWAAVPGLLGLCLVRGSARRLSLLVIVALPFLAGPALQTMRDWAAIFLPVPALLFAIALIVASDRKPKLLATRSIGGLLGIFGVVLPFLPMAMAVGAASDNPWDELCRPDVSGCLGDPTVWADFMLGCWALFVAFCAGPSLVLWELYLLVTGRRSDRVAAA